MDFAAISLSPTTGTLELRGIFPQPGRQDPARIVHPGARAYRGFRKKPSLVIPEVAVGYDQLGSYVLVVGNDKIMERRSVELGARLDTFQVVRNGLTGEDWVIVNGQMQAVPGRPVTPVREPLTPVPEKTGAMPRANHAREGVS